MKERAGFEKEIATLDVREYQADPQTAKAAKGTPPLRQIILVAGVEYPRYCKRTVPPETDSCKLPAKLRGKKESWWVLAGGRTKPARDKANDSHWRKRCLLLAQQRLKLNPNLQVLLFDFDKATRESVILQKGKLVTTNGGTFSPVVDEDFRRVDNGVLKPITTEPLPVTSFKQRPYIRYCPSVSKINATGDVNQADWLRTFELDDWRNHGLSIRNVYQEIEKIGKNHPYTLLELHLFGHASSAHYPHSGTAFINTDHFRVPNDPQRKLTHPVTEKRHPLDVDARADLDFVSPTVKNIRVFRMAFARGAMSFVWGCNWHRPVFDIIRQANVATKGKAFKDTTLFEFRWHEENVSGEKDDFKKMLRADLGGWDDKANSIQRDGKFLREMLIPLFRISYMQQLANASAHCVTGGLPGTYSEYDEKNEKDAPTGKFAPRLSHIPMGGLYGTKIDFRNIMRFFATNFGTKFNREGAHKDFGRGFALYCPEL